ncbi:FAD-dependent oxidoreductase [Herbiconiux sp. CPCC 205763]|uniref:FAD-dependent oxidoreductase n=1 Tax=Herbiconiux aconitum TaxID=2970913 RepID=A0ABT2GU45_9MICO|nr:FAD-dependent oxidoreductase [Herbiconiux aconitum]MCS5719737.1 FAD-dependent oxidoreductase [Herbiconiux aconitum]
MTSSIAHSAAPTGVLVVGAGISGIACARALRDAGVTVRVVDRARRPGGRMSGRTLQGRVVDLGASYFTVPAGSGFSGVVERWVEKGLARPWTDTFAVIGTGPDARTTKGPMRYSAAHGLRSLVVDLADGLDVGLECDVAQVADDGTVDGVQYDTVVLAMPEPQAARMLAPASPLIARLDTAAWEPTIAVALGFAERAWPAELHGAFVEGSSVLTFVADDGDRRGDRAPVIVAHSTAAFAREHLDAPEGAVSAVPGELRALLGLEPSIQPAWNHAHRWTFARAASTHPEPFALHERIGVCGDAWGGRSSVATAWASGDALGRAIAGRR